MEYNKIEQQEKPETKQPTDKNDGKIEKAAVEVMKAPEDIQYEDKPAEEPKKSLLARFIDLFVGSNGVKAAAKRVYDETVKPSLISLGVEFAENTFETMVYGTAYNRGRRSIFKPDVGHTQYNNMYAGTPNSNYRPVGEVNSKIRKLPKPLFRDSASADEFLDSLDQYIRDNGRVTVYQYLQLAGWIADAQPTDRNWGWYTIRSFSKRRAVGDGGWAIEITREPESL